MITYHLKSSIPPTIEDSLLCEALKIPRESLGSRFSLKAVESEPTVESLTRILGHMNPISPMHGLGVGKAEICGTWDDGHVMVEPPRMVSFGWT